LVIGVDVSSGSIAPARDHRRTVGTEGRASIARIVLGPSLVSRLRLARVRRDDRRHPESEVYTILQDVLVRLNIKRVGACATCPDPESET
jgi:hypothetical protein